MFPNVVLASAIQQYESAYVYTHIPSLMQLNTKKKITQSKNGQKTKTNISPKKTYKWSTNNEKMLNVVHY